MQKVPIVDPHDQSMQDSPNPEAATLARVYALILQWPAKSESPNRKSAKEDGSQNGLDRIEHQAGVIEVSTLKTE